MSSHFTNCDIANTVKILHRNSGTAVASRDYPTKRATLVFVSTLALSSTIERIRDYQRTAEYLRQLSKEASSPEAQSEFSRCAQMYDRLADESRQHAVRHAHERSLKSASGRG